MFIRRTLTTLALGLACALITAPAQAAAAKTYEVHGKSRGTVTVNVATQPISATHFLVTGPATTVAGVAFGFTVSALDQFNNIVVGYTGTVHFTSSDTASGVVVPGDYTFLASDNGVATFPGRPASAAG